MTLPRVLYTGVVRVAAPVLLAHLARRTRRQTGERDDWRARLGLAGRDLRHPVWIHAASAGEMQAAAPLVAALAQELPVRVSAFTATGRAVARRLLPDTVIDLAPLDLPGAWRRYLERIRPRLAILLETELWPNLLAVAAPRHLPVVLASARLTPGAARRLARFPCTARAMLGSLERVLAQTDVDLERFVALGLPPERGCVTGNLKDALMLPHDVLERGRVWRTGVFAGRRVWVAGSVRLGEEAAVAEAAAAVRTAVPEAVAVVAPRHPENAHAFAEALARQGFKVLGAECLEHPVPVPAGSAVLVNRVGILQALYAAAEVAFVGGTLLPMKGHNVLEPALVGVPVVTGPSLDNVRQAAERLKRAGGLVIVRDGKELGREIVTLLRDPDGTRASGAAAKKAASNPMALTATLAELRRLLR